MDKTVTRIRAILSEADKKLLDIVAECAKAGDLAGVDTARMVAGRLRSVSESFIKGVAADDGCVQSRSPNESSRKRTRVGKLGKFPRFEVRNATLYRIGWSKKKNEQYEHKVPRNTVNEIITGMVSLVASGSGPFTAEQIIQRVNQRASVSVPNYQVYVVIGWLRAHELVEQLGRDGYQIPGELEASVESVWTSSNTRRT
jgi:hypothetical protein